MSYTIYYRKQFILVGQGPDGNNIYIPMVESGDNNVYESNRKRSRDWMFRKDFTEGNPVATEKEMLDNATESYYTFNRYGKEDNITEKEYQSKYGYYSGLSIRGSSTSKTTWGMFLGIIKTGCKQAIPLNELPGGLKIWLPEYSWTTKELEKQGKKILDPIYVKTTEEYLAAFKVYSEYYGKDFYWHVDFNHEWDLYNIFSKRKCVNREKRSNDFEYIPTNKFFILVSNENGGTFVKNTKYGYKYSHHNTGGKQFLTKKDANTFHRRMRNKDCFTVKEIDLGSFHTVSIKRTVKKLSLELAN